jgi:adenylate cyclase
MSDVFISYSRSTETQAKRVAEALRALGYGVWRDDQLPAHRSYAEVIEERLSAAKAVVVVWSAEAVKSEWVQSEADRARLARKLVQLTVDGAHLPMPFDRIQCADLTGWSGDLEAHDWKKVVASVGELVGGAGPTPAAPAFAPRRHSICVLPFANMSGDPEQEYFSDGISEDIITDLSKVSALSVVARNTAFTFKGQSVDVPEVAARLNVSHVLEGSVRKAGGRVRITAQLIDGAAGDHVWAERYDRDLTDIFALQDEISEAIVAALKVRLLPEEKQAIVRRGTNSAEAYDLYLMARRYRDLDVYDPRRYETVIRLCERAIKIDPEYARAWELMSGAQAVLRYTFGQAGDGGAAANERALALDPNLAEAHARKGRDLQRQGRPEEALAELELALRLDPESHDVNFRAGNFFFRERRFADAVPYYDKAVALNEESLDAAVMLQSTFTALGNAAGARRAAELTLERAEKVLAKDSGYAPVLGYGVAALASLGQRERAREWIDRALLLDADNFLMRYNFACALSVHLQDADGAIELLRSVFTNDPGGQNLSVARTDPDLDPIRGDPRFQALMAEAEARLAKMRDTPP